MRQVYHMHTKYLRVLENFTSKDCLLVGTNITESLDRLILCLNNLKLWCFWKEKETKKGARLSPDVRPIKSNYQMFLPFMGLRR